MGKVYYSKKSDFEKGDNTGWGHSNINCVKDLLSDIEEVASKVKSEGLSDLYVQTGEASLGKDMPESTFVNAEHRALDMLESAKEVHKWVMQNIDGKFVQGIDDALKDLDAVNEGDNTYTSDYLTYEETRTQTNYNTAYGYGTTTTYNVTVNYTISDIINSPDSPIPAAKDLYQIKLQNAKANLEALKESNSSNYEELSKLSEEELVEAFNPTQLGEYEQLRSTHKEKYKDFYNALEIGVKAVGTVVLIAGTILTAGTAAPLTVSIATLAIGTALVAGDQIYEYTTGESISGRPLSEAERNWSGVGALMTILTAGTASYSGVLLRAGQTASRTAQTVMRGVDVADTATEVAETGHKLIMGEDPLTTLGEFAFGRAIDGAVSRGARHVANTRGAGGNTHTNTNTTDPSNMDIDLPTNKVGQSTSTPSSSSSPSKPSNVDLKNSDLPNNSVESKVDVTKGTPPIGDNTTKVNRPDDLPDIDTKLNNGHGPDGPEPALVGASPTKSPSADSAAADLPKPETHLDTSSQTSMPSGSRTRPSDVDLPNSKPDVSGSNSTNNTIPEANLNKGDVNPSRPTNSASPSSSRSGSNVPHVDTSKADTARPRTGDSGKPSSGSRGNDVSHVDTGKADLPNKAATDVASAGSSAAAKSGSKPADIDVPKSKTDVSEEQGRKVYGPYYEEAKQRHIADPDWNADPDMSRIVTGEELAQARKDYKRLVRRGELPSGHHRQGLAFGGENTADNIQFTGETTIKRSELDGLDLNFYHERKYGKPGAKVLKLHQRESGIIVFGTNRSHDNVTQFQNKVLRWQKSQGLR